MRRKPQATTKTTREPREAPRAPVLRCRGAFVVELIVIFALTTLISLATFGIVFFIFPAVAAVLGFTYRVLTLASGSATWGMRLMGIELRRHDAGRLSLADAFVHTLAFYISFGIFPVQLISVVMMLTTARGQGLTDMLFGTVALNTRA